MGNIDLVSLAERAWERADAKRQAGAESEVQEIKSRVLRDFTSADLAENMGTDWLDAALRVGDAELIGQCCLLARDSYAERIAVRDVYGIAAADRLMSQLDEDGWRLVAECIARKAGAIQ